MDITIIKTMNNPLFSGVVFFITMNAPHQPVLLFSYGTGFLDIITNKEYALGCF